MIRYQFDAMLLNEYLKAVYGRNAFAKLDYCDETGLYVLRLAYEGKYVELELDDLKVLEVLVDFLHEAKVKSELLRICRDTLFGKNS
ncbi:MAG: hypothetical protein QW706_09660 [Candidatus Nezhaarchaeales archaeon]